MSVQQNKFKLLQHYYVIYTLDENLKNVMQSETLVIKVVHVDGLNGMNS